MKRKHNYYFICEEGHITIGDSKRTKCGFQIEEWKLEPGKKNKYTPVKKGTVACTASIKEIHELPDELKLNEVWDWKTMHAFLYDQKIDADFMLALQKMFTKIQEIVNKIVKASAPLEKETY